MIKINLLPTEKRKAERTPLPRFLLIASTAAAFFILLFYNLWILKLISDERNEIARQQDQLRLLQPFVQEHDRLRLEEEALKNKVREIEGLINRDVEFWRTVNALWEVIHQNKRVWIDTFQILDARGAPGELKRGGIRSLEVSVRAHGNDRVQAAVEEGPVSLARLDQVGVGAGVGGGDGDRGVR